MTVKITRLEAENVKRVKAVAVEPTQNGLTVIGGRNNQGKTSVLDAIAWALGGDKFRPASAKRDDSMSDPKLHVELSNGIVVERSGKGSDLKVTDTSGNKSGQTLLNSFVEKLALDLPKFIESSDKEKAETLLNIIGVGDKLHMLEMNERQLYNQRTEVGRIAEQKAGAAADMPEYTDAPDEPVSAAELIEQQQAILARNGQRQQWRRDLDAISEDIMRTQDAIETTEARLRELKDTLHELVERDHEAQKTPKQMQMETTDEIEASINAIDAINEQVRVNAAKAQAMEDAAAFRTDYDALTAQINDVRAERMALLQGAELPLDGLSVDDGALTYQGKRWDDMSGSDQLRVATAIVRNLNPECGFVLVDKLEQMDTQTLAEFGDWAESQGLQIIATRVSTGGECSIVIEDGYVAEASTPAQGKRF